MKNNKVIMVVVIAVIVVVVIAAVIYISGSNKPAPTTNQPLIGGQTDEGGCLIAAGYSWCEPKQKCLRIWEEKCYETEEADLVQIFAAEHNKSVNETNVTIVKMKDNYASGSISFGKEPGEGGGFLVRQVNGDWLIDFEGNGSVDCPKIRDLGYPQNVLEGYCDMPCPEDAKVCPDGSTVSRIRPDCEFAPCPSEGVQESDCVANNGTWLEQYRECEYVSQTWCAEVGGIFYECESACRHIQSTEPVPCTLQCVPVCKF